MTYERKETGAEAENLAAKFLKKAKFKILEMNLTNKLGEIDILARDRRKGDIVVVEVKAKSTQEFGEGFEMVNFYKRRKLILLAKSLQIRYPKATIRIDVVSVDMASDPPEILHFENAVEENT